MSAVTANSRWAVRLAWLGGWMLSAYLAWGAAHLTWLVVARDLAPVPVPQASVRRDQGSAVDLGALDLFGRQSAATTVAPAAEAPETRLQLSLLGVFTSQQPEDSGAIVSTRGGDSEYFRVGESLPGQAELLEVHADHVVLLRQGKREKLSFETGAALAVAQTAQMPTRDQFISEARKRLENDPQQALASVGLRLGDGAGYIYDGSNPMLSGMNLQSGDRIVSVNGTSLGNVEQDKELLGQIMQGSSVEIEVERDGTSFSVQVPLRW